MATCTFDMCKLEDYLLQGGKSIQSLRVRDFEPMHRVRRRASNRSKASGLGDKAPEAGEYLSNKYEIRVSPTAMQSSNAFRNATNEV